MAVAYGSCFGNAIAWSQASAAQNTWYPIIDTDIADGVQTGSTENTSGSIAIGTTGDYQIVYSVSVSTTMAPRRVEVAILVNDVASTNGQSNQLVLPSTGPAFTISSTAILTLTATDTVKIAIRTIDGGYPTLSCDRFNVSVVKLSA